MLQKTPPLQSNPGLTLLEVVLTITLVALLAAAASYFIGSNFQSTRYENTRAKMDAIRRAVVGDRSIDNEGKRTSFGYYGDMGQFFTTLTDLTTIGTQPAWAYNSSLGVGAGWRGPYYNPTFTSEYDVTQDEWGTPLSTTPPWEL